MNIDTSPEKIKALLTRGVENVIEKDHLEEKLKSGKQSRVKFGIDPTSPNIHIGRSIPLLKLKDFQELGHKIVFIIGDFTGVIGDTSDKDSERPMLSAEQVKANMKGYFEQAAKIIDMRKCEKHYNSEWLKKLNYHEIGEQADQFSVAEFIARENIKKRLNAGRRVSLREALYPLMQGYDSVAVKADVEVGGTDQWFNILAGRKLQEHYGQEPQDILVGPLLEGTDGRKMSSSWGNTINLTDEPSDMFGKVMSIPDSLIIKYFTMATRLPLDDISEMARGGNPRDAKMRLAREIVTLYYSAKEARQAEEYFVNLFQKHKSPREIKEFSLAGKNIVAALVESGLVKSNSDARRNIKQKGVKINNEVVADENQTVKPGDIIQKGKRYFIRIK